MRSVISTLTAMSLGVTAAASLVACASSNDTAGGDGGGKSGDGVTIAVVMEQTGALSALAVPEVKAIQLAVDEVNAAGGVDGKPAKLLLKDSASEPARAAAAAREVANQVSVVIGAASSASCHAMQPILDAAKVFQYCQSPQSFDLTPNFFHAAAPVAEIPGQVVPWLRSRGIHKIALISQDDVTGTANERIVSEIVKSHPDEFQFVENQKFASGSKNVETQMTLVRNAKPDLIYAGTSGANLVPIVKAMNALDMKQPVFVAGGSAGPAVLDLVKGDIPPGGMCALALWVNFPDAIPQSVPYRGTVEKFASAFREKYGASPGELESGAYDSTVQILTALKAGARTGSEVSAYLESHPFTGVLGAYTFTKTNHQGAHRLPLAMAFGSDGRFTLAFDGTK